MKITTWLSCLLLVLSISSAVQATPRFMAKTVVRGPVRFEIGTVKQNKAGERFVPIRWTKGTTMQYTAVRIPKGEAALIAERGTLRYNEGAAFKKQATPTAAKKASLKAISKLMEQQPWGESHHFNKGPEARATDALLWGANMMKASMKATGTWKPFEAFWAPFFWRGLGM